MLVFPAASHAAELFLEPASGELGPGSEQRVALKLKVTDGCVNTVKAELSFPSDYLQVENVLTGNSLLHIWVDKPANTDLAEINRSGKLHLAGGIPGGYCGRIPGDPGESDVVAEVVFSVPGMIMAEKNRQKLDIDFTPQTKVLLNDGMGSEGELETRGAEFKFTSRAKEDGQRQDALAADKIKPEPFVVELHQDEDVFGGAYFVVFSTVDKQTGIDHYEVLELAPGEKPGQKPEVSWWQKLLGQKTEAPQWQTAQTPYKLKDQSLQSTVKVKAIDKAGNTRVVEYIPDMKTGPVDRPSARPDYMLFWIIGAAAVLVLVLLFAYWLVARNRNKENNFESNDKEEGSNQEQDL